MILRKKWRNIENARWIRQTQIDNQLKATGGPSTCFKVIRTEDYNIEKFIIELYWKEKQGRRMDLLWSFFAIIPFAFTNGIEVKSIKLKISTGCRSWNDKGLLIAKSTPQVSEGLWYCKSYNLLIAIDDLWLAKISSKAREYSEWTRRRHCKFKQR